MYICIDTYNIYIYICVCIHVVSIQIYIYIRCILLPNDELINLSNISKLSLKLLVMARWNLPKETPTMYPNSNLLRKPYEIK